MAERPVGTQYTPATLYDLADAGFTDPAAAILADAEARKDYDTRARHGIPLEMAFAWGVAAFAAGDEAAAGRHWCAAARLAPENRAARLLCSAVSDDAPGPDTSPDRRVAARAELARVRHNSAFPHRLVRFAAALASEPEDITPAAIRTAREMLEQDIREAPRSYAMVLPVVRGHYPAVYSLDRPFLDATASVLADRGPRAKYQPETARRPKPKSETRKQSPAPMPDIMPPPTLPPLRLPTRRWVWPRMTRPRFHVRLPNTGYAWVGALVGAAFFLRDGWVAMAAAAVVGFLLAYAVYATANRS